MLEMISRDRDRPRLRDDLLIALIGVQFRREMKLLIVSREACGILDADSPVAARHRSDPGVRSGGREWIVVTDRIDLLARQIVNEVQIVAPIRARVLGHVHVGRAVPEIPYHLDRIVMVPEGRDRHRRERLRRAEHRTGRASRRRTNGQRHRAVCVLD